MSTFTRNPKLDRTVVEQLVREIVEKRLGFSSGAGASKGFTPDLVVNISARHMHIRQEDLETLFGPGTQLGVKRMLYQEGQFASDQAVTIIGPRHRTITNLRILGPCRKANQIELSFTDGIAMGLDLPVRMSGKVEGTPGVIVLGPKGHIEMKEGVIRALPHVHMNEKDAEYYGINDGDRMLLKVKSVVPATFENIVARIDPSFKLEVHIDTDEGNACDLTNAESVELVKA
jgi:putative phosphotransacetylase